MNSDFIKAFESSSGVSVEVISTTIAVFAIASLYLWAGWLLKGNWMLYSKDEIKQDSLLTASIRSILLILIMSYFLGQNT